MLTLKSNVVFSGNKTDLPGFFPILDVTPVFCGGVRRIIKSWSGPAVNVRRGSDDTAKDFYYLSDGSLDTASILSFCGSSSGYVVTIYDQSGNGNNATRSAAAGQPKIVTNGTLNTVNGKPCIAFTGGVVAMGFPQTVSDYMTGSKFVASSLVLSLPSAPAAAQSIFNFPTGTLRRFGAGIGYTTGDFNKYQTLCNNESSGSALIAVENDNYNVGSVGVLSSWVDFSAGDVGVGLDGTTPQTKPISGTGLAAISSTGLIGGAVWTSGNPTETTIFNFMEMILVSEKSTSILSSVVSNQRAYFE